MSEQVQKEFDLVIENDFTENQKCQLLNNNDETIDSVKEECAGIYYKTNEAHSSSEYFFRCFIYMEYKEYIIVYL